jgi:phosphoenolpyruvate-protein kinase (PTS system EI component)
MSAVAIPAVRAEVTNVRASQARKFAKRLLKIGSVKEIRENMAARYGQRHKDDSQADTYALADIESDAELQ